MSGSTHRSRRSLERRDFLRLAGVSAAAVGLSGVLAPFGEADSFTINGARTAFKNGL